MASPPLQPHRDPLPDVARGGVLARFAQGAAFAIGGIGFVLKRPALLRWTLLPMLIQTALFVLIVVGGFTQLDALVARFGPEAGHWYSFLGGVLFVGGVVALLLCGLLGALFIGGVLCDPFYDLLSEAVETALLGKSVGAQFSLRSALPAMVREAGAAALRLSVYLLVAVPLWIVGLSGVGSLVAAPLSLAWTWAFVALEALARSQARHAVAAQRRFSTVTAQPIIALGFGALGWLLAFIPLTTPFLVVGGTRLYLALAAWDRVPSALTDEEKARLRT